MDQILDEQLESQDPRERAEAIRTMALSGKKEYLDILEDIHEFDPHPKIKEYARRAALHLFQNLNESEDEAPQPVVREPYQPRVGELTSVSLDAAPKKVEKQAVSRPDREKAEKMVQRAFTLYSADNSKKAIKVFVKALEINPGLEGQTFAGNLAMELTGLPLETAFASLRGDDWQKDALKSVQDPETKKDRKPINPVAVLGLILALVVLGVVANRFLKDGTIDRYRVLLADRFGAGNVHSAGDTSYLMLKPLRSAPPAGWPVVVALHGQGGEGADMMGISNLFTREGILFIAPNFNGYAPNPGDGPQGEMVQILNDVSSQVLIDPDHVVLLGFSQGGTFAYRFSIQHPEWVGAVVTAGAPDLSAAAPSETIPYVFTWGENDGLQDIVLPADVYPLVERGFDNIRYYIISNTGHEVTPYAIETAIALAGQ